MAITTVERVLAMRPGLSPQLTAKVERRHAAAERYVIGKLGYDPQQAAETVRASGTGTQILALPGRIPITSVASLTVDQVAWTVLDPGGTEAQQYVWVPDHGLWLEARGCLVFTEGRGNVLCTKTAGYPDVDSKPGAPEDLQEITGLFALVLLGELDGRLGKKSVSLGKDSMESIARNWSEYETFVDVVNRYAKRY